MRHLDARSRLLVCLPRLFVMAILCMHGCNDSRENVPQASISVVVSPASLSVKAGDNAVVFTATLRNDSQNRGVTWSLASGCTDTTCGTLSNVTTTSVSYTPPMGVPSSPTIVLTATSAADHTKFASVKISISSPAPLAIATTSLPGGQVGATYSTTLQATGGVSPYSWAIAGGTLPAGLNLDTSTGAIKGTPTQAVGGTSLGFTVTDSASHTASATLSLTITASGLTVAVSPKRTGLTVTQSLSISATTNDTAGVTWTATGGIVSPPASRSAVNVTYTAASAAGAYTITATSVTDVTQTASITVGVTDLAGVYTYHNDLARDGANTQEYALTPSLVSGGAFGKLFSCTADGAIYAQPLWAANLSIGGAKHNVVFVATEHDSVFAFDADASPCVQLWKASLIDTNHGGTSGETSVPYGLVQHSGPGGSDIAPEIGVTSTPVIDPSTNTLYVMSKSSNASGTVFQRLHAIDITTGDEKFGGPTSIDSNVTYPGMGDGGTTVSFSPHFQLQRAGLALVNGVVYVAWASHGDILPYYGWVIGFDASTLAIKHVLNVSPNVQYGGIWMSGAAPAADNNNNLYLITSNATFDVTNTSAPNNDYGDSALQLSPSLTVKTYFTPSDQATENALDHDFGSGGAVVLNLASGSPSHLVIGGGKVGTVYLLDGDSMGGLGDSNARQYFNIGNAIFSTGAFWNNMYYIAGTGPLVSYSFDSSTRMFNTSIASQSTAVYGFPSATPSVSAQGASSNGIVWVLANASYCTSESHSCGPTILRAYDATNLDNELWSSFESSADTAGLAVKFTVPTVANGKVYVGTRGNNSDGTSTSASIPGELDVYGLKPN